MATEHPEHPCITATMPVRDRAHLLEESARSVLAQTERDIELLILDDGSTDATWDVAQALAESDPRVRLLRNDRSVGIPAARNQLLAAARGRYLAIADSDDLWETDAFSSQRAMLDADEGLGGVGVRISCFTEHPDDGAPPGWHWGLRDGRLPFAFSGAMLRADAMRAVGGFDERWPIAEDVHLTYRMAGRGWRFDTVPGRPRIHIRVHRGSVSVRQVRTREWCNLRAQLVGLRALRGRFSLRGYLVLVQSLLRVVLATVGLRRR